MDACRHGFLTGDHRPMATVLAKAAIRRELAPEARIGPAGIALLPQRAPPEGQRYRVTLGKAREELERYLPPARQQAADRLRSLIREGASSPVIAGARTELAYVRHAKRSEEPTSELQSLMRNSYAVFCLKKKTYHYFY